MFKAIAIPLSNTISPNRYRALVLGVLTSLLVADTSHLSLPIPHAAESAYRQARMLVHSHRSHATEAQALRWMRYAAQRGHADAQYQLGSYLTLPRSGSDFPQAATWLTAAAQQGQAQAMLSLAYLYASGQGVNHDLAQAFAWARLAQDYGEPESERLLRYLTQQLPLQRFEVAMQRYFRTAERYQLNRY